MENVHKIDINTSSNDGLTITSSENWYLENLYVSYTFHPWIHMWMIQKHLNSIRDLLFIATKNIWLCPVSPNVRIEKE